MKSVLLTGFAPFDREAMNPSWEAVRGFAGQQIAEHAVEILQLPVEFRRAREQLIARLRTQRPALVLCLGQAGGRSSLALERVAINLADARIPDNAGSMPRGQTLVASAPAAFFAPLDLEPARAALLAAGIPCEISLSAGSYVCNDVFYGLCLTQASALTELRGTFVHIPYAPEQVLDKPGVASMSLNLVQRGWTALLEHLLTPERAGKRS